MKRYAVFALLAACFWLAGCASTAAPRLLPGDAAPIIKIGLIAPFEGLGRPLGYGVLPEVQAAIDAANADGSLGPYRVALVALNDDLTPASAAVQTAALSQDPDVVAVLGPFTSDTASAAAAVLAAANIPVLLAAPSVDIIGARSLCPPSDEIQAALESAARATGFVLSENEYSSCSQVAIYNKTIGSNSQKQSRRASGAASLSMHRSQTDNTPRVFFPGGAEAAADELLARRAEGWAGVLIGGPDVLKPWFVGRAGEAGEGTRAVACTLPETQPRGVLPEAALARGGTQIILDAIAQVVQQGRQPDRASVTAALASAQIAPSLAWYEVHDSAWRIRN